MPGFALILSDAEWAAPLWLTARVAAAATVLGVAIGGIIGFVLARRDFRGRDALDAVVLLPIVLPPTVLGYFLLVCLGQRSWIGQAWTSLFGEPLVFSVSGAIVAASVYTIPLVAKSMRGAFAVMDRTLEDAARVDGAGIRDLFRYVYLPQVAPPLLAAGSMAFARAIGDFGVTLMVAGNIPGRTQTASIAIYDLVAAGRDREAFVLALIVSVGCVFVVWLSAWAGAVYRRG